MTDEQKSLPELQKNIENNINKFPNLTTRVVKSGLPVSVYQRMAASRVSEPEIQTKMIQK